MAGYKYHYRCPNCGTQLQLKMRVTQTKRRCPHCATPITPQEIDRQKVAGQVGCAIIILIPALLCFISNSLNKGLNNPYPSPSPMLSPAPSPMPTAIIIPQETPAPQKCRLTIKQSPPLRGLRLGMSMEEVGSRVPLIEEALLTAKPDTFGVITIGEHAREKLKLSIGYIPTNSYGIDRVRNVYLKFLDRRLIEIEIVYSDSFWRTLEDFVAELSKSLNLPSEGWEDTSTSEEGLNRSEDYKFLECQGFHVVMAFSDSRDESPMIRLEDILAQNEIVKREKLEQERQHAEQLREIERKRRTFQP
jgi:hypothetical protein